MKKTIKDYKLKHKKVLIRVDFNVPMKNGKIADDNRIQESLPTIQYALEQGAKVILLSHLGRVKTEEDLQKNSLKPVAQRLEKLLHKNVIFVPFTRGEQLEKAIQNLKDGEILLIENTRFEDLDGKKESTNDQELGAYWASLGDIYINDAFGTAHRAHASNVGIASHLPSGIGFLVEKELENFEPILNDPEHPFVVILGGSKVSDKIHVIENLVKNADTILIGGGMAYTFLASEGYEIGASLFDKENIDFCKKIVEENPNKIILPIDTIVASEIKEGTTTHEKLINDLQPEDIGVDIGSKTVKLFKKYLENSKTVVWNGPVGIFEIKEFANGTKDICKILSKVPATTIIGGGDTASAVLKYAKKEAFTHISTGGGASLEMLEGKNLPGVAVINDK